MLPIRAVSLSVVICLASDTTLSAAPATTSVSEQLWVLARRGDADGIKTLIESGVDVNAKTRYGVTALSFACSRGHVEVAKLLLDAGAEVNTRDSFYRFTPLRSAMSENHFDVVKLLVEHGATDVDRAFRTMVARQMTELVRLTLAKGHVSDKAVRAARKIAKSDELIELLSAHQIDPEPQVQPVEPELLKRHIGLFERTDGNRVEVLFKDDALALRLSATREIPLTPVKETIFEAGSGTLEFRLRDESAMGFTWKVGNNEFHFQRVDPNKKTAPEPPETSAELAEQMRQEDLGVSSANWPQFRGTGSRGIADGQRAPVEWDATKSHNVRWKTAIPGLGHSCPVTWGDRIYLTTAVTDADNGEIRVGLYGDVDSVEDDSVHRFEVICLDKGSGQLIWTETSSEAAPSVKRHLKSTHANPTPATDGRHVVALFGSEGLFCYDTDGGLLWKKDLGTLDSGWFYDPDYQWAFGSSPVLYKNLVIVQCDIQKGSFVAAFDIETGAEVWKQDRDEIPTWSTPTIHETPDGPMLLTNGTRFVRGCDAETGSLRWQLGGNSEIVVPTPVVARGLIFAVSGYGPIQPIHAIHLRARGDITPAAEGGQGEASSPTAEPQFSNVAWTTRRGGTYLPTPIVYREYLYTCSNSGILTCYHATTGMRIRRSRLKGGGTRSFAASPVASDGHLYFTSEVGDVYVIKAGPELEQLHVNPLGEYCLATPAISDGVLFFRGHRHLIAIEESADGNEMPDTNEYDGSSND